MSHILDFLLDIIMKAISQFDDFEKQHKTLSKILREDSK